MCEVDLTNACQALGMPEGVSAKVVFRNLNNGLTPELAILFTGGLVSGQVSPARPTVIQIDIEALAIDGEDPRKVIAHELVHVLQMARYKTTRERVAAYAQAGGREQYLQNRLEIEADEKSQPIVELVELPECLTKLLDRKRQEIPKEVRDVVQTVLRSPAQARAQAS